MVLCRSKYVKKVMKLLAFIFEQPSYNIYNSTDYDDEMARSVASNLQRFHLKNTRLKWLTQFPNVHAQVSKEARPLGYLTSLCSTQLSTKIIMLYNVKMLTSEQLIAF